MRPARQRTTTLAAAGLAIVTAGCTATAPSPATPGSPAGRAPAVTQGSPAAAADPSATPSLAGALLASPPPSGQPLAEPPPATQPLATQPLATQPLEAPPLAAHPLAGTVVVIDPGHNGGNGAAAGRIARLVDIGNGRKACDTTGAQTAGGYPESAFTWDVANRLAALLRRAGATVVLTRSGNAGVGPCITERAAIGNRAHADAAISIHADGAPAGGYGFHVIEPVSIGSNAAIVAPSARLALAIRAAFAAGTGEPLSTYTGGGRGLTARSDLGGLNRSAVPKVFIECANMRNAADARRLADPAWRQRAAAALAAGLTAYLRPR